MENSNQMGFDPKMYEEILKQFEKIKTEAGIEPDEDYDSNELEDLLGMGFDDLEEEIYKLLDNPEIAAEDVITEIQKLFS